jgi:2'-5' RNA ligase
MRLFTGIDLPQETVERLQRLLMHLRPAAALRWSKVENLHITTKFIGEWPQSRLVELKDTLGRLDGGPRFRIRLEGLGWFPNANAPRILWVGVMAPPELVQLAARTEVALARLGVEAENREFKPHLTLARIGTRGRPAVDLAELRRRIDGLKRMDFGEFECESFHLYLSEPVDGGSHYTRIASYAIAGRREKGGND